MNGISRRGAIAGALAAACWLAAPGPAAAQNDYPNRPVVLIVGYAPGGAIDQSARLLAHALTASWGRPVVVENRAGANGTIAATAVANAKPDGYTLLVTATSHTLNKFVMKNLRYDPQTSFAPVALTVDVPNVLVVNASSPYRSVGDLLAAMRAKRKEFNYASQGLGGIPHLAAEMFKLRTRTDMTHVPYKGASQGMTDLIAGIVDMSFPSPGSVMSHIDGGKLRALAVSATQRFALLKDVPTFAEAGVDDFTIGTWHGVLAPAATPPAIVAKLNADINEVIRTAAFSEALAAQGNAPAVPVTPAELAARLARESRAFAEVAGSIDLGTK